MCRALTEKGSKKTFCTEKNFSVNNSSQCINKICEHSNIEINIVNFIIHELFIT